MTINVLIYQFDSESKYDNYTINSGSWSRKIIWHSKKELNFNYLLLRNYFNIGLKVLKI